MTLYGALYFMVHDGLVHQRWPFRYIPRRGFSSICR
jgi:beta-carotene 3-hydroxylase